MTNPNSDSPQNPGNDEGTQPHRDTFHTSPLFGQLAWAFAIFLGAVGVIWYLTSSTGPKKDKGGNALNPNQVIVSEAAAQAVELKTEKVVLEPGAREIRTNGVIHFSPYSTINVSPRLTGRIQEVFVKVGDHVSAAQPLASMVSSDAANAVDSARDADEQLKLTAVALATARKQFLLGTPEVTSAEAVLISAQESTRFNKRMLDLTLEQNKIGGFTDKPLTDALGAAKQAETQLAQDLKDLALDQSQYDRTVKLFGYGVAAKVDVENAEDTLGKQKDAVSNDKEQLRIAKLTADREEKAYRSRLYANQIVRQAQTNYDQAVIQERAATTALSMVKAALLHDLKQAEHDYQSASADDKAAHTVLSTYDNPTAAGVIIVRAPASGVVTARNINPGQIVDQTGETPWQMVTITNSGLVYVDAQVYEKDMPGLKVGLHATATSDALPANFVANGVVSFVSPALDPASHALSVRAELDNKAGLLKDGMFVSTVVEFGSSSPFESTPVIPLTAVVHDGNHDYVFLVSGKGKYERTAVVLGDQRGEDRVAITKGLTGGETIVSKGALFLGTGGTSAN